MTLSFSAIFQIVLVVILALVPAIIWLRIWKGKNQSKKAKRFMLIAFALGALSVFPVFLIHYIWQTFPQTDIINLLARTQLPVKEKLIVLFVIIAILEEIAKFLVVLFIDKSTDLVNSIRAAIRYSVVAALGFAFAENIHYFYSKGLGMELYEFLALFSFRSIITVCGHLVFSGIFGNFYGISKFSKSFSVQKYWGNLKKLDKRSLSDKSLKRRSALFSKLTIAKGLFFAVAIHAVFNYTLQSDVVWNAIWLIILGFIFLIYLYKRESGYINLLYRKSKFSHMRDKDKDVVFELLGTWYTEGKYNEVIETCERLLKKDPNNPVIQLFLHKARDNRRFLNVYMAIRRIFVSNNK